MKQTKTYEAPRTEVLEIDPRGIVCASDSESGFNGTLMNFSHEDGEW